MNRPGSFRFYETTEQEQQQHHQQQQPRHPLQQQPYVASPSNRSTERMPTTGTTRTKTTTRGRSPIMSRFTNNGTNDNVVDDYIDTNRERTKRIQGNTTGSDDDNKNYYNRNKDCDRTVKSNNDGPVNPVNRSKSSSRKNYKSRSGQQRSKSLNSSHCHGNNNNNSNDNINNTNNVLPDEYKKGVFRGKLDGLDRLLFNRSMGHVLTIGKDGAPVITVPVTDQTILFDLTQYKGKSFLQKGYTLNIQDVGSTNVASLQSSFRSLIGTNTTNLNNNNNNTNNYEYGCTIKWNKVCFTIQNMHDEIISKCYDSTANKSNKDGIETTIVYGICPMSKRDAALEIFGSPKLYRWVQIKINTVVNDNFDVDLCSGHFYTPIWTIRRQTKNKRLLTVRSKQNDAVVAWIAMDGSQCTPNTNTTSTVNNPNSSITSCNRNWTLKTRRGLDPALFTSIVGVLLRHEERQRQVLISNNTTTSTAISRAVSPSRLAALVTTPIRRNKSLVNLGDHRNTDQNLTSFPALGGDSKNDLNHSTDEATTSDAAAATTTTVPAPISRSRSWDANRAFTDIHGIHQTINNRLAKKEKGDVEPTKRKGGLKHSTVFKVVHGVVISPFRASAFSNRNSSSSQNIDMDDPNIWVGPEEIIRDRYLNKREGTRSRIDENHHLRLSLENLRTCFQVGQRVQVQDVKSKLPFVCGALVKLRTTSFVLKDSDGMRVAKCLEDPANQTSLILGVSPLYESDRLRKQQQQQNRANAAAASSSTNAQSSGGNSNNNTSAASTSHYFPWLQVTITDGDMSIDLWTGHSYTSLWYCEKIHKLKKLKILSSENDDCVVGEFYVRSLGSMDVKTDAGLDPAIFICLAVVVLRNQVALAGGADDVLLSGHGSGDLGSGEFTQPRRTSSKVFRVVNGEVVVPFHAQSMDFDESEVEEAADAVRGNSDLGIWVGPDEVVQGRFMNKGIDGNASMKLKLKSIKPTLRLVYTLPDDNDERIVSVPPEDIDCMYIEDTETSLPYPGCSKIRWTKTSFFLTDNQNKATAMCMEDRKNLTYLVCGECPLFPTDEPIERTSTSVYYPWLQVKLDDDDLAINLWSGHGYTALWFAENVLTKIGFYDILSAEFETSIGKVRHDNGNYESIAGTNVDPSLFVCLSAIMCRIITVQRKDE